MKKMFVKHRNTLRKKVSVIVICLVLLKSSIYELLPAIVS